MFKKLINNIKGKLNTTTNTSISKLDSIKNKPQELENLNQDTKKSEAKSIKKFEDEIDNNEKEIQECIEILNFYHTSEVVQNKKRNKAYKKLQEFGLIAKMAIPKLIEKLFDKNENKLANETLNQIDSNWSDNKFATQAIPFLIKKLEKDTNIALKSSKILQKIGDKAIEEIIEKFKKSDKEKTYLRINIIKTIAQYNKPEYINILLPQIKNDINNEANDLYIESICELLINAKQINEIKISDLLEVLSKISFKATKLKIATVFEQHFLNSELIILPVFSLLNDENDALRNKCVSILSKNGNKLVEEICIVNLNKLADTEIKDLNDLKIKLESWIEKYNNKYKFSGSWLHYDIQKDLEQNNLLIESILKICNNIKLYDEKLYLYYLKLMRNTKSEKIKIASIKILGNFKNDELYSEFISLIPTSSKKLMSEIYNALNNLNENWTSLPANNKLLQNLLNKIEFSEYQQNITSAFNMFNSKSMPILMEKLKQGNSRIINERIINILHLLESDLTAFLPELKKSKQYLTHNLNSKKLNNLIDELDKA